MCNNIFTIFIFINFNNCRFIFLNKIAFNKYYINNSNLFLLVVRRRVAIVLRYKRSNINIIIIILFSCFLHYFVEQYRKYNCFYFCVCL